MLDLKIDPEKCTRCGSCVKDCPYRVLTMEEGACPTLVEERVGRCIRCQHCLTVCPTAALSILGRNPADSLELKGRMPSEEQMSVLIKGRRSVRSYKPEPLNPETISRLLSVVANCPTGENCRQVCFTVIEEQKSMERFRQAAYESIRQVIRSKNLPKRLRFFEAILHAWDKGQDVIFRQAPHLLIASVPKEEVSPEADAIIALTSFDLLAQSMGIGTLWNGMAKQVIETIAPELKKGLGLPGDHLIGYIMIFGRPAVHYHRTVQRDDARINRVRWP